MELLKKYKVHIKSITPLIQHSDTLCNPLHPLTKQMKEISSCRKKQDEHYLAMAKLEWNAALYFNEELGFYMPAKCILACLKSAARKFKLGKHTKAVTLDFAVGTPLIGYENATPEDLWARVNKKGEQENIFCSTVVIKNARVVRTLPIFYKWECKFEMYLNIEILSEKDVAKIFEVAGLEYGIGELRPERASGTYGRFSLESFKEAK